MGKNKIVTFDFDGVLTEKRVKEYARKLVELGVEVHIITARYSDIRSYPRGVDKLPNGSILADWSKENLLYSWVQPFIVADEIGIDYNNIHFSERRPKSEVVFKLRQQGKEILWHLDDDFEYISELSSNAAISSIFYSPSKTDWHDICDYILQQKTGIYVK